MKRIKMIAMVAVALALAAVSTACAALDVVGKASITSFEAVLNTIPGNVQADEANAGWALTAPDESARFIWSEDYSRAPLHDVMLEFDAQPFLDAGLDPSKLPDAYSFYEGEQMGGMGKQMRMLNIIYKGNQTAL